MENSYKEGDRVTICIPEERWDNWNREVRDQAQGQSGTVINFETMLHEQDKRVPDVRVKFDSPIKRSGTFADINSMMFKEEEINVH